MSDDVGTDRDLPSVRRVATDDLPGREVEIIRELLDQAFGSNEDERFTEDDWKHAVGGMHFVVEIDSDIVAHAAVVERELQVDGRPLRTGYVEAVATAPVHRAQAMVPG